MDVEINSGNELYHKQSSTLNELIKSVQSVQNNLAALNFNILIGLFLQNQVYF